MPFQNRAAWLKAQGKPLVVESAPYTAPRAGEITIRNGAVAVNPADCAQQSIGILVREWPLVHGCDAAGAVVAVGPGVTTFKVGDRVTGVAMHCDGVFGAAYNGSSHGAFQDYVVLLAATTARIPDSITFEQAAVLPLGLSTAACCLYYETALDLSLPPTSATAAAAAAAAVSNGETVFIWGGSSSVGSCAVQLAVASGYGVFTTASKRNHDYCRSLGATQVFDHSSPDVVQQVLAALEGKVLAGSMTAIAGEEVIRPMAEIVLRASGSKKLVTIMPGGEKDMPEGIEGSSVGPGAVTSKDLGPVIFEDFLTKALEDGRFKCKPDPLLVGHGLESIQKGLDTVAAGVSAAKVVISL